MEFGRFFYFRAMQGRIQEIVSATPWSLPFSRVGRRGGRRIFYKLPIYDKTPGIEKPPAVTGFGTASGNLRHVDADNSHGIAILTARDMQGSIREG